MITVDRKLSLERAFPGARGCITDADGTCIHIEHSQEQCWKSSVSVLLTDSPSEVRISVVKHVEYCFKVGDFSCLTKGLMERLGEAGLCPPNIHNEIELDEWLTEPRKKALLDALETGEATIIPTAPKFLRRLAKFGYRAGLYTASPMAISQSTLELGFGLNLLNRGSKNCSRPKRDQAFEVGRNFLNEFLPPEHRVFGDMVTRRKPDPSGWVMAAQKMGLAPGEVFIVEDRPINVQRACGLGFRAIGLCRDKRELPEWEKMLGHENDGVFVIHKLNQIAA